MVSRLQQDHKFVLYLHAFHRYLYVRFDFNLKLNIVCDEIWQLRHLLVQVVSNIFVVRLEFQQVQALKSLHYIRNEP